MHGTLSDPYGEFFIYANSVVSLKQQFSYNSHYGSRRRIGLLLQKGTQSDDSTIGGLEGIAAHDVDPLAAGNAIFANILIFIFFYFKFSLSYFNRYDFVFRT